MAKTDYTFVKWDVSDFDIEIAIEDLPKEDDFAFVIPDWIERGYKVSITSNPENGGYCVTLTGKDTGTDDDKKVMSAWSGSIAKSVAKLFYLTDYVGGKIGFVAGKIIADEVHDQRLREFKDHLGIK